MNLIGALWQSLWVVPTGTQDEVPNRESGGFLVVKGLGGGHKKKVKVHQDGVDGEGGTRQQGTTVVVWNA